MELQDLKSPETTGFIETLDKLTEMLRTALSHRTPHFNGEKYLTTNDLKELLHMSERLLQNYRNDGTLPYIKISGKILYKESDALKLLQDNYIDNFSKQ